MKLLLSSCLVLLIWLYASNPLFAAEKPAKDPATGVHVLSADELKIKPLPTTDTATLEPNQFVEQAAMRSNLIVILSNLARERARHADLKAFAEGLATTHEAWFDSLSQLASTRGVLLPNELTAKESALTDHLTEIVDLDFDQDYLWHMLGALRAAQAGYTAVQRSTDAELKTFAHERLPQINSQLDQAIKIGRQLRKSGSAGSVNSRAYPDPNTSAPAPDYPPDQADAPTSRTQRDKGNVHDEPSPKRD